MEFLLYRNIFPNISDQLCIYKKVFNCIFYLFIPSLCSQMVNLIKSWWTHPEVGGKTQRLCVYTL